MYDGFVDELVELLEHKASTDDVSNLVQYPLSSAVLPPFSPATVSESSCSKNTHSHHTP